jgi:hypothetical protein
MTHNTNAEQSPHSACPALPPPWQLHTTFLPTVPFILLNNANAWKVTLPVPCQCGKPTQKRNTVPFITKNSSLQSPEKLGRNWVLHIINCNCYQHGGYTQADYGAHVMAM